MGTNNELVKKLNTIFDRIDRDITECDKIHIHLGDLKNCIKQLEDSQMDYVVEVGGCQWNNLFFVTAKNRQDAINQVWESQFKWKKEDDKRDGYEPVYKNQLSVCSVEGIREKEQSKVICLN